MWNPKPNQNKTWLVGKKNRRKTPRDWGCRVGDMGGGGQNVQTHSYKFNKS